MKTKNFTLSMLKMVLAILTVTSFFSSYAGINDVNYSFLQALPYSSAIIDGSDNAGNQIPTGTWVAYKTSQGRLGIFEVAQYGYTLKLNWVTYNADNSIYSQGTNLAISGTWSADLDLGVQVAGGSTADFFWQQSTAVLRYLVPSNGAKFYLIQDKTCFNSLNPLSAYNNSNIGGYQLSAASINGSDNTGNKIPTGTRVLYRTNGGRYGIFEVAQYGYNLVLNYITYSSNGTIYSRGCNLLIRGTFFADLDGGTELSSSAGADFWWEQNTATVRTVVPQNGARFFVLPSAACEAALAPLKTFTNATISSYQLSSASINGSDNTSNKIPTGTRVLYQTNGGRYGILEVAQYGYNLVLNYVTYSSTGAIYAEGCGLVIRGTFFADLDGGTELSSATGADFWWEQNTATIRTVVPQNGAKFFVLPSAACEASLAPLKTFTNATISSYQLSSSSINGSDNTSNKIPTGTRVLYQTNGGRYGILEVAQYGYNLVLNYVTYSATGAIYAEGCGLVIRGTFFADLDKGSELSSATGADFWWEQNTATIRTVVPQNGAKFFVLPSAACEASLAPLKTFTNAAISNYQLSSASIDGSDNSSNKIPTGTRVLYQTNGGRYGILEVAQYGYNLVLNYVTYNAAGAIYAEGCGLVIRGTFFADLDKGTELSSATGADFWWEQNTATIRTVVPQNRAKFFVLPSAACEASLSPLKAFTNAAISNYQLSSASIDGSDNTNNHIPTGTRVLYKTNGGRNGILQIAQYGYNLVLNYVTYSSTGAIYAEGCGLIIRGTFFADLDGGSELSSATGADFWWEQNTATIRTVVPQNGAKFFVLPSAACENSLAPLKNYSAADISTYPLSTTSIDGSDNAGNRIPAGTRVLYRTNTGRYGIFQVAQYGYNLVLNYVTYSSTGTIHAEGCGLVVRGTFYADLDEGAELSSSTGADFWWEQNTATIRTLVPQNGAAFYVLPAAALKAGTMDDTEDAGLINDRLTIYPVPAKDHIVLQKDQLNITYVKVYNASGLLVKEVSQPSEAIDVHELAPGLYYLQYSDGAQWNSGKFLKE